LNDRISRRAAIFAKSIAGSENTRCDHWIEPFALRSSEERHNRMEKKNLPEVTDSNFDDEVRRSTIPVIVDFWAPWCGPCKIVQPILHKLAGKYEGTIKFVSMNVDQHKATPSEFAIRSIPTLLFFKEGIIKNQMIGAQSEENIDKAIKNLL
jgi:thioredoxin